MLLLAGTQDSVRGQTAEDSAHRTYKGVMVSDLDTFPRRLAAARAGVVRINAGKAEPHASATGTLACTPRGSGLGESGRSPCCSRT